MDGSIVDYLEVICIGNAYKRTLGNRSILREFAFNVKE